MRAREWRQGVIIGILLLVAIWLLYLISGLFGKAQVAVREANEAKQRLHMLEERQAALGASIAALNSERGQEAAIRTAFGVVRPGEEVIVVVPPDARATTTVPWWQKILDWFNERD